MNLFFFFFFNHEQNSYKSGNLSNLTTATLNKDCIWYQVVTVLKPLTVWITRNCRKFLKRLEYQIILPASWETSIQVKKQQLELDRKEWTGSKLGKGILCVMKIYLFFRCEKERWRNSTRSIGKAQRWRKMKAHYLSKVLSFCTVRDLVALLSWDVWSGSNYGNIAALSNVCVVDNFVVMLLTWITTMMSNVGY